MRPFHYGYDYIDGSNATVVTFTANFGYGPGRLATAIMRHGTAGGGETHDRIDTPNQSFEKLTAEIDANTASNNRRKTLWQLKNPPSGLVPITFEFSAQATQYSLSLIFTKNASHVDEDTITFIEQQNGQTQTVDIKPRRPHSLLYVSPMTTSFSSDPFSPIGRVIEIADSDDEGVTNHSFAVGWVEPNSVRTQTYGFTADEIVDYSVLAFEVLSPAAPVSPLYPYTILQTSSTSLFATGDQTITDVVNESDAASPLSTSVDDDPASPDDNDWVNNAVDVT